MNIFTVSFFGHRQLENFYEAENELERIITELISKRNTWNFLLDEMANSISLQHLQ